MSDVALINFEALDKFVTKLTDYLTEAAAAANKASGPPAFQQVMFSRSRAFEDVLEFMHAHAPIPVIPVTE